MPEQPMRKMPVIRQAIFPIIPEALRCPVMRRNRRRSALDVQFLPDVDVAVSGM